MKFAAKVSWCTKKGKNLGIFTVDDVYNKKMKGTAKYKNAYVSDSMKQA